MNISTNLDELEKLLSLATNQTKQLQETLSSIDNFELGSGAFKRESKRDVGLTESVKGSYETNQ
ncbi:hypothetical protein [Lacticaseibacillus rhamnosus]|uniref:hypothetical protein n=1 Tax=Lacticaseibacillus rhamnosus TaxID=47715 RepID=UPI0039C66EE6